MNNLKFNLKTFSNSLNKGLKENLVNYNIIKELNSNPISIFRNGNKILIKKQNRGKFTEYCGGKVTSDCILKGKNSTDPKIRKRATFAANARKWKHKDGGIIRKYETGTGRNGIQRVNWNELISDPIYKRDFNFYINPDNMTIIEDSLINRNAGFPQRVATFSLIISESGGETKPHGNGAYGLIGWRGPRAKNLPRNLSGQTHLLMEGLFGEGSKDWTHGGEGMGINSGKEMKRFFQSTPNIRKATNAIMRGYVRPEKSEYDKRLLLSQLLKNHMK